MAGQSILVVDDNVEFAVLLGTLISEQGFVPVLAHNAETAMTLAKQYAPSGVVLDLLLPDMTGHKLLAALAKLMPLPPIFVITGVFKGQAQMEKLRAVAPVAAWHEKPFDTRVLIEQIVQTLGSRPAVLRQEHHTVAAVTKDFDINILEPIEDVDGIRPPEASPLPKEPSADIELEVEVDEQALAMWDVVGNVTPMPVEEDREDEPGIVIDDLMLNATGKFRAPKDPDLDADGEPTRPGMPPPPRPAHVPTRVPSAAFSIEIPDGQNVRPVPSLEPQAVSQPTPPPLVAKAPALPPRGSTPRSSQVPKSTDDGFVGPGTGTNPWFKREHSPTPYEMRIGLRAKMRSGNLKSATVPRLLTAFFISHETGEIVFEKNGERKIVYFNEGRPVYARSNQAEDRLGAFAKRKYGVTDEQVQHALEIAKATDRMLGDVLIAEHVIAETNKSELLREQTRSIIKSLLTWSEGRYVIGFNAQDAIERAEVNDHPAALVLTSVRELFDLDRLRALVPDRMKPMPSPNPPYELHDLPLGDAEALLLLRSTGARTVEVLIKELAGRLDERSARANIYGLLTLGVLVAGRAPPKESVPVVI
jgi:CheY-like chemotaxis protein